jgi:hypothetical protein
MAEFISAIHDFYENTGSKSWMPGTRPGMTAKPLPSITPICASRHSSPTLLMTQHLPVSLRA